MIGIRSGLVDYLAINGMASVRFLPTVLVRDSRVFNGVVMRGAKFKTWTALKRGP